MLLQAGRRLVLRGKHEEQYPHAHGEHTNAQGRRGAGCNLIFTSSP